MHTETERAWLAGFIDGEGYIGIDLHGGVRTPSLRLSVTNTNVDVMAQVAAQWNAHFAKRRKRKLGWKEVSDVVWSATRAADVLREVQPYLRIKGEQCRVALEFAATVQAPPHHSRRISEEVVAKRLGLYDVMRSLNARGVQPAPTS